MSEQQPDINSDVWLSRASYLRYLRWKWGPFVGNNDSNKPIGFNLAVLSQSKDRPAGPLQSVRSLQLAMPLQ